uniref:Ovule protein n=1 Tax=Steinernema glaseri TaxID=37863 RepID=A0A1I7ZAE6_9BILA
MVTLTCLERFDPGYILKKSYGLHSYGLTETALLRDLYHMHRLDYNSVIPAWTTLLCDCSPRSILLFVSAFSTFLA